MRAAQRHGQTFVVRLAKGEFVDVQANGATPGHFVRRFTEGIQAGRNS
jgi:hypothetical protein